MTAPQVTPAMVEAVIASEHYCIGLTAAVAGAAASKAPAVASEAHVPLAMLTICMLVTKNGHTVVGESHCADPARFNTDTGRSAARAVAINKLWPMVVYAERARLAAAPLVLNATPEQLAQLREAMRNAPPMQIIPADPDDVPWIVIKVGDYSTLPAVGKWLVTVETDDGREVHTLTHHGENRWVHNGKYTDEHIYHFHPIAWAPRPEGYTGEVPA